MNKYYINIYVIKQINNYIIKYKKSIIILNLYIVKNKDNTINN